MNVGGQRTLQESIEEVKDSLDQVSGQLERLEKKDRTNKILFAVVAVVFLAVIGIGFFAWNSARNSRDQLAQNFEQTTMQTCENSQESRVRLRGVFELFVNLAVEASEDPQAERVVEFQRRFSAALMEAVPNRDCEQEARERQAQ
jgi:uncharacterized protein HemX